MKLFFDPQDAESAVHVKSSLAKLRGIGVDRLLNRMIPYIQERLGYWDEIVKDEFPDESFSAITMLRQANSVGNMTFLIEPIVLNESLEEICWGDGFRISTPSHTDNRDFSYVFLRVPNVKISATKKAVCIGSNSGFYISDRAFYELKELALLDKVSDLVRWTIIDFGHDFMHTIKDTTSSSDVVSNLNVITHGLFADDRNARSISNQVSVAGSEDLLLQINQQIFLKAREANSPWFRRLLLRTEKITETIEEVAEKCSPEVAKNFTEMMAFFVSNYVPRELLLQSNPREWVEILKTAEPQVKEPKFWLDDKPCSIAELSLKYQQALMRDIANQRTSKIAM